MFLPPFDPKEGQNWPKKVRLLSLQRLPPMSGSHFGLIRPQCCGFRPHFLCKHCSNAFLGGGPRGPPVSWKQPGVLDGGLRQAGSTAMWCGGLTAQDGYGIDNNVHRIHHAVYVVRMDWKSSTLNDLPLNADLFKIGLQIPAKHGARVGTENVFACFCHQSVAMIKISNKM